LTADQILKLIKEGEPPKKIAQTIFWKDMALEQREALFQITENHICDEYSHSLLSVLYYLTVREFPWDVLRVLGMVVRSPIPYDKKINTFEEIGKRLEGLRESIAGVTTRDAAQIERYKFFEADYFAQYGIVLGEENKTDEAIRLLAAALGKYQALGANERVSIIKTRLDTLNDARDRGRALVPIQSLRDQRELLQNDISALSSQAGVLQYEVQKKQEEILHFGTIVDGLQEKAEEVNQRIAKQLNEEKELLSRKRELLRHIQELTRQASIAEVGLQFLFMLPQMATAPLWLEVVRLSIQQGEMDDFTIQALTRLTLAYPDEATPLFAQVAARFDGEAPAPNHPIFQALSKISRVASSGNENAREVAEQLLEAWDIILNLEGASTHA